VVVTTGLGQARPSRSCFRFWTTDADTPARRARRLLLYPMTASRQTRHGASSGTSTTSLPRRASRRRASDRIWDRTRSSHQARGAGFCERLSDPEVSHLRQPLWHVNKLPGLMSR
jgi:hypothetical protein